MKWSNFTPDACEDENIGSEEVIDDNGVWTGETDCADGGGTDPNEEGQVWGCSDPNADNYNPNVTIDNGTCDYGVTAGCMDSSALNYNPNANYDDGSCYNEIGGGDNPVYGCTNPVSDNYNPLANVHDGSCFDMYICSDPTAVNYNEESEWVGGVGGTACLYNGCTDTEAFNFEPNAINDDGSCVAKVFGCKDSTADNYDDTVNIDDGSCNYPTPPPTTTTTTTTKVDTPLWKNPYAIGVVSLLAAVGVYMVVRKK